MAREPEPRRRPQLRRTLLAAGANPLTIPAAVRQVAAIPKLGSGKTDFAAVKRLALSE